MTYPYPQGGYNPQDPYNQGGQGGQGGYNPQDPYNQGGGYPQTGGFPQQPGGGYPPGPPKQSNTTLIVSIVAVVVLALGALGITGFVAPGFFLGDDDSGGSDTSTAQGIAQAMVSALNAKDREAVTGLMCASSDEDLEKVTLDQIKSVTLNGPVQEAGDTASVSLRVELALDVDVGPLTTNGKLAKQNGSWCWQTFDGESSASAGTTSAPGALPTDVDLSGADPFLRDFLSDVNSGDESAAIAKLCQDYARSGVEMAVEKGANVTLGAMEADTERSMPPNASARWEVSGNLTGKVVASTEDNGATWCVQSFSVF